MEHYYFNYLNCIQIKDNIKIYLTYPDIKIYLTTREQNRWEETAVEKRTRDNIDGAKSYCKQDI